jgi:hypothetical protein
MRLQNTGFCVQDTTSSAHYFGKFSGEYFRFESSDMNHPLEKKTVAFFTWSLHDIANSTSRK